MYTLQSLEYRAQLKPEGIKNLVYSGGGILGIAYVGAQRALERLGIMKQTTSFAGASAGAINAMIAACGYDAATLLKIMKETPFPALLDSSGGYSVPKMLLTGPGTI